MICFILGEGLIDLDLKAKLDCSLHKNKVIEIPVAVFFSVNISCIFSLHVYISLNVVKQSFFVPLLVAKDKLSS